MKRLHNVVAAPVAIVALLVIAPSQAQEKKQARRLKYRKRTVR